MAKIYLAGSCSTENRTTMMKILSELKEAGQEVYAPFEFKVPNAWDYSQEQWAKIVFENDIKQIDAADIVIVVSPGRVSTAGSNWEQGYAYAKGKRVIVIQTTEEQTSLMTFHGCDGFINAVEYESLHDLIDHIYERKHYTHDYCYTTLT